MSTNESATWPHTGVTAPIRFEVLAAFYSRKTTSTTLIGAEVIHPDLGSVGMIQNAGDGGPSTFHAFNNARFGIDALKDIAEQATQDGTPLDPGETGIDHLLDMIMAETAYAEAVTEMQWSDGFLMRTWSRRRGQVHRGPALPSSRILLDPEDRASLAERYARSSATRLAVGETWEFFNGKEWKPLNVEPVLSATESNSRLSEILAVYNTAAQRTSGGHIEAAGPLQDGMYVTGAAHDGFLLTDIATKTRARLSWCTCPRPSQAHRFERWNVRDGHSASGTLHSVCDRMLTID